MTDGFSLARLIAYRLHNSGLSDDRKPGGGPQATERSVQDKSWLHPQEQEDPEGLKAACRAEALAKVGGCRQTAVIVL